MHTFKAPFQSAIALPEDEVIPYFATKYPLEYQNALDPTFYTKPKFLHNNNTQWLKTVNTVGVNIRTIQSFYHLLAYAICLPKSQQAIHILPIWEPGVVASLYGPSSWQINPEFFSVEFATLFPHLDTVEKQLKVVINLLHVLGKVVGMDVVPHTDRFSEMVLSNPAYFEWLERKDLRITRHDDALYKEAEQLVFQWLSYRGAALENLEFPNNSDDFFHNFKDAKRNQVLFGAAHDYDGRLNRRKELVQLFYEMGLETAPATMAPPYRGLQVNPDESAKTIDEEGRIWRDYTMLEPQKMSRAFGPLSRYKLWENKDNNTNWEIDFGQPKVEVFNYVSQQYAACALTYGFDFMRGDMSHVQMRPNGVPTVVPSYYDIQAEVKKEVQKNRPWFGYFAESFMAPPGEMAYGDESEHLEASLAETTLGDLQSEPIGTAKFMQELARYRQVMAEFSFNPCFTLMTADKDDPRFDSFYAYGNAVRYFLATFLVDMPSYMGLGYECRDVHTAPAPNEHYTKLYVFALNEGPKATNGPYIWGQNEALFQRITSIREVADSIFEALESEKIHWKIEPDSTGERRYLSWKIGDYFFTANLHPSEETPILDLPAIDNLVFSQIDVENFSKNENEFKLAALEVRIYCTGK